MSYRLLVGRFECIHLVTMVQGLLENIFRRWASITDNSGANHGRRHTAYRNYALDMELFDSGVLMIAYEYLQDLAHSA